MDLDWNPSTWSNALAASIGSGQRGSASTARSTYLPYLAKTQDEKMYRVVRDRERRFQVVMGAAHELDEGKSTTSRSASSSRLSRGFPGVPLRVRLKMRVRTVQVTQPSPSAVWWGPAGILSYS
jgi:hypothetical protein